MGFCFAMLTGALLKKTAGSERCRPSIVFLLANAFFGSLSYGPYLRPPPW
jgi:hypothetical protein